MLSKNLVIAEQSGLHLRPAAKIAAIAGRAISNVWIINGERRADAKSALDMLLLGCGPGACITVKVDEWDDADVLDDIVNAVNS